MSSVVIKNKPYDCSCSQSCSDLLFNFSKFNKRSLCQKISVIAFHIFTLCIPIGVYKLYTLVNQKITKSSVSTKEITVDQVHVKVLAPKSSNVIQKHEHEQSIANNQPLGLVQVRRANHPPKFFISERGGQNTLQPINKKIGRAASLYTEYEKNFLEALKKHKHDPWSQKEVVDAADKYMKIAFKITKLTLEDLEAFTEKNNLKNLSPEEILLKENSYMRQTLFYCTQVYHKIRSGMYYDEQKQAFLLNENINPSQTFPFYQPSTKQAEWRSLYNQFCSELKGYVKLKNIIELVMYGDNLFQKDRFEECYQNFNLPLFALN
jgi:hypothetical protein